MIHYDFKIGDKVITTEGVVGAIIGICDCVMCKSRGFNELIWKKDNDEHSYDYITNYDAENGFGGYYMIGNHRFNDFDKDLVIRQIEKRESEIIDLKHQLELIKTLEEWEAMKNDYL